MLTIDEIRAVPLFSNLTDLDLERLAHNSADWHLNAGEFVVHVGGARAVCRVVRLNLETAVDR